MELLRLSGTPSVPEPSHDAAAEHRAVGFGGFHAEEGYRISRNASICLTILRTTAYSSQSSGNCVIDIAEAWLEGVESASLHLLLG
jgi:hypothetical protein